MESVVKEARKVHIKEDIDRPQLLQVEYEDDKQEEFTITINVKINKRNIKSANWEKLLDVTKQVLDMETD
tara:strand:- start:413 stop:622 length:210 start_codon:yes stop_codon:yes gene_type:complete